MAGRARPDYLGGPELPVAPPKKKLGEILIEMGALDPLQLQVALAFQQQWGVRLGRAVVEKGFCARDDVTRALATQAGHPMIRLDGVPLDPELAKLVPAKTAEMYRVVPLRVEGRRREVLALAIAAPAPLASVDAVLTVARKQRALVQIAHDEEIESAIGRLYHGKAEVAPAIEPLARAVGILNENVVELEDTQAALPELDRPAPPPPPVQARPVALFGWHEASMRALQIMISRGGEQAAAIPDEHLGHLRPDDVLLASTLGLQAVLAPGQRLPARLIICGITGGSDVQDAKALGARLYLRPPFSTEQLVEAVRQVRRMPADAPA